MKRLKDIAMVSSGQNAPQNEVYYKDGSYSFIKASNLDDVIDDENEKRASKITESAVKDCKLKEFSKNTIVFAKSGLSCAKNRVYLTKESSFLVNHLCAISNIDKSYDPEWLAYFIKAFDVTRLIKDESYPSISLKAISDIEIPELELAQQREIASFLNSIKGICKTKKQELESLDSLVKSLFVEMFGDVLRNSKGFETCSFEAYVNQMNIGPFGSDLKNDCFVAKDDGYCMVYEQKHAIDKDMNAEARYITKEKYEKLKRFDIGPGDIIVSCRGTIGECFILPSDAPHGIIHPSLMMIKPNPCVNGLFLKFLLEHILAEQTEQGSGVKMAIKAKDLAKITTIKPPRSLQDKFVCIVSLIDKSRFVVQKEIKDLQELLDSKMDEYFGGDEE